MGILKYPIISFGCDPELFLEKDGKILGSEKVIPKEGLEFAPGKSWSYTIFVRDGVQIEANPSSSPCRAEVANAMAQNFRRLREHLATVDGVKTNFSCVVEVTPEEMESLSPESRRFGCAPSLNLRGYIPKIDIDGVTYMKRAAGGHIHLGLNNDIYTRTPNAIFQVDHRKRLVPLMDALVGLPCVLIDRDPGQVERRKHYGRAAEFRLPPHGLEYRTLSNFWLRHHVLFGFVTGMSRMATAVLTNDIKADNFVLEEKLFEMVDLETVWKAIDENNLGLAKACWEPISRFIAEVHPQCDGNMGLAGNTLKAFEGFYKKVEEKGLEFWFPEDPLASWCALGDQHEEGWESFLKGLNGE